MTNQCQHNTSQTVAIRHNRFAHLTLERCEWGCGAFFITAQAFASNVTHHFTLDQAGYAGDREQGDVTAWFHNDFNLHTAVVNAGLLKRSEA